MSSRQSAGGGSRSTIVARLPAIDLIGASELFISWPMTRISRCHACRSSSRSGWLRSESTSSSCGRPPWRNRLRRISQRPTPPGKAVLITRGASPVEAVGEVEFLGVTAEQALGGLAEQPRAGAVHEPQFVLLVEGEHGDVDLRHDLAQQCRCFQRVEPLLAQRLDQRVHLDHHLAQRIAAASAARADREVPFAERREQIGEGLQREDDALAQREGEAKTEGDDEDRQRPLDLRRVIAGPEKNQRNRRARAVPTRTPSAGCGDRGSDAARAGGSRAMNRGVSYRSRRPALSDRPAVSRSTRITGRSAEGGGRARCGSSRGPWRPG